MSILKNRQILKLPKAIAHGFYKKWLRITPTFITFLLHIDVPMKDS